MMKSLMLLCVVMSSAIGQFPFQRQEAAPMIPPVRQYAEHYNGPAVAEAVLKYWGLPAYRLGIMSEDGYQKFLAQDEFMASESSGTTTPENFIKTVNHIVSSYDLNERRLYSRIELAPGYSNVQDFFEIVTRSLARNVPVAVAFMPRMQEEDVRMSRMNFPQYSYILITSVSGGENPTYTYIDTSDGALRQFDNSFLAFITSQDGNQPTSQFPNFVIAHLDPADQVFLNFIGVNQQMQSSPKCSFFATLTSVCQNLNRTRRQTFRQTTCQAVDATNPLTNFADHIYVIQKLIGRNGIQVRLSRTTAMTVERFYIENDRETFLRYMETLLARVVQKGTVLDSDRQHAAKVIFDGMPYIHEKILALLRLDDIRSIFVQTYRAYSFHDTVKSIGVDETVYVSDVGKI